MGFAIVTPLLLSKNMGYDTLDDESPTEVCSLVFTFICEKEVPFKVQTAVLNVKYSEIWRKMNPLDYHVWGYMKAMVYAHKVNMREELFQQILSAARSINNAAVLCKVTSSPVTRVIKCIQAVGGHFEQFARVLNGEFVTAHLTT